MLRTLYNYSIIEEHEILEFDLHEIGMTIQSINGKKSSAKIVRAIINTNIEFKLEMMKKCLRKDVCP